MAHFLKLVALAAVSWLGTANAAYTNLPPPPGFGGSPGAWTFAPSNADDVIGKVMRQSKSLPVPGTTATMGVAYKLGPTAAKVAAAALYLNPYVRTAAGIATWIGLANVLWSEANQRWEKPGSMEIPPFNWPAPTYVGDGWSHTKGCHQGQFAYFYTNANYAWANPYIVPLTSGCVPKPGPPVPLTKEQFERELAPEVFTPGVPSTMPESVPKELPKPTPLPVELPVVNPTPGQNPTPQPKFVPTGEPVPNPKYDPQQAPSETNKPYLQPGVRVTPKPTPAEPWRVDLVPVDRPQDTPDPVDDPESTDSKDKPKPDDVQSLCEKHPDIVACKKLGAAEKAEKIPDKKEELSIVKNTGWGPENGTCPAPKTVQVGGFQLSMPFDLLCQFADGIRPVVIGLAWLAAAFTFMGIGRRS